MIAKQSIEEGAAPSLINELLMYLEFCQSLIRYCFFTVGIYEEGFCVSKGV
jgi:hypothetical protein